MTRAGKSRDASARSAPTPAGFSSPPRFMAPISRTATAPRRCWPRSVRPSPGCGVSSPTAAMPARSSRRRCPCSADGCLRSSNDPMPQGASNSYPPLGGRTHRPLARPQLSARQGLRSHHRKRRIMAHDRKHPASRSKDRKSLKYNTSFPARP